MPARRRELLAFCLVLAVVLSLFFGESLFGGKVLSPADVVFVQASFDDGCGTDDEPANRLLMDPVLQFEPWLEFNRSMLRAGRLPLWNPLAGCGAPHLANGQSAVFDPFHAIAYLGTLPEAHAWMAASRLWVAGLGMFLLAGSWGLGRWGRWFSGLAFPLCGFLVLWLLYPPASVAVWMPWLFWAGESALRRPSARRVATLAVVTGFVLLGGHIQTSAHLLIAAFFYVVWRWFATIPGDPVSRRGIVTWAVGIVLGVALAAVEVVPLGVYLSRSPVWSDREADRPAFWTLGKPRILEMACNVLPYAFGSQRRGQPHLAPALGVENLNESAGGFAGLATLLWLAPLGWSCRRASPRARFLGAMVVFGAFAGFELPPVSNVLRILPILNVTDNRRLLLWVAFGLILLGGIGLDWLERSCEGRVWGWWPRLWAGGVVGLVAAAILVGFLGPTLREKAVAHYEAAARETPGADAAIYRERAERQVRHTLSFVPWYLSVSAGHGLVLAGLLTAFRRGRLTGSQARRAVLGLTVVDLFGFGYGLNPAIAREAYRPKSALVDFLRRVAPPPSRILAIEGELPPNLLMRYGLADCRNYDSIELSRSVSWFDPLYEPEADRRARTSRRRITWQGVARGLDRLREAGVAAVVGPTPPPKGVFPRVDRVGRVWVARLEPNPAILGFRPAPGQIRIDAHLNRDDRRVISETFDPGWTAEVDGRPVAVEPYREAFLSVRVPSGSHRVILRYSPPDVWIGGIVSLVSLAIVIACFAASWTPAPTEKTVSRAWTASSRRGRIELVASSRSTPPAFH